MMRDLRMKPRDIISWISVISDVRDEIREAADSETRRRA
jgi:hypothetical protein